MNPFTAGHLVYKLKHFSLNKTLQSLTNSSNLKTIKKNKTKSFENMKRIVCFQDVGEMVQPAEDSIVVISNGLSISGEMIGVGGTKVGFQIFK